MFFFFEKSCDEFVGWFILNVLLLSIEIKIKECYCMNYEWIFREVLILIFNNLNYWFFFWKFWIVFFFLLNCFLIIFKLVYFFYRVNYLIYRSLLWLGLFKCNLFLILGFLVIFEFFWLKFGMIWFYLCSFNFLIESVFKK